jgi:demethylmenaquinone methyltransferase/2-methoxy-6-polyprenyl-1,4-benzoquinol methylase
VDGWKGAVNSNSDFYAMVAPVYDLMTARFLATVRKDIVRAARAQKCRRILEVACGTGELAVMLAKAGFEVTGVDLSPAMLAVARRKSPPTVAYFRGNGENLPFESDFFDCVTISLALHEMPHEMSLGVAGDILRVLAPGGKLIVFDYAALRNKGSALGLTLMGLVEKMAGAKHFRNFVRFTRSGGIDDLLESFPLTTIETKRSFLGALQVVTMRKAGDCLNK